MDGERWFTYWFIGTLYEVKNYDTECLVVLSYLLLFCAMYNYRSYPPMSYIISLSSTEYPWVSSAPVVKSDNIADVVVCASSSLFEVLKQRYGSLCVVQSNIFCLDFTLEIRDFGMGSQRRTWYIRSMSLTR